MKPLHRIDLIFSVNGKITHIHNVSDWTTQQITDGIKTVKKHYPELSHKFKIKGA